MTIYLGYT